MSLNTIKVENLRAKKTDYRVADGGGLYLLVRPNELKLWRYDYRLTDHVTGNVVRRTFSIGEFSLNGDGIRAFTLKQAREEHEAARATVAKGEHPVSPAQRAAKANAKVDAAGTAEEADLTFGAIADTWLASRKFNNSPKTYARDERSVRYLKDGYRDGKGFGHLRPAEIEAAHLSNLGEHFQKPTRVKLIGAAKKIMAVAKRKGLIKYSPFSDVDFHEGLPKHRRKSRPAITDEKPFAKLLRDIDAYNGRVHNLSWWGLKLLTLVFVRPDTMAKARWEHFDLEKARWVIPFGDLKMEWLRIDKDEAPDDYIVPLSRQAVALLKRLHKITGKSRYLFPGCGDAEVMSENTMNFALHSMGYKGIHCAHGFRSSASTLLNRQRNKEGRRRFDTALVEIQQDRLDSSTRAIYDRDDMMPERVDLMQFWADKVDELRGRVDPPEALHAAA